MDALLRPRLELVGRLVAVCRGDLGGYAQVNKQNGRRHVGDTGNEVVDACGNKGGAGFWRAWAEIMLCQQHFLTQGVPPHPGSYLTTVAWATSTVSQAGSL